MGFFNPPFYENVYFTDSDRIYSRVPFFAKAARSQSTTRRRLSRGNTAEGTNALLSRSTGIYNTGVGIYSLLSLTEGSFCTGVGAGTLLANTADENTATGAGALLNNTTGTFNTANGAFALFFNANGSRNTATGVQALFNNSADDNTADGYQALLDNTTGTANTATGTRALMSNTTGQANTATGFQALQSNTIGLENTASGQSALLSNTNGSSNTASGSFALSSNTEGIGNTASGAVTLLFNTIGNYNTAYGRGALESNTSGAFNTAIGHQAGFSQTNGNANVYIGDGMIGVAGESNACYIASIFGQTSTSGIPVLVNSSNRLGTATSSQRFKKDVKPMGDVSEALFSLTPVTFQYKSEIDPAGTQQLGLVAEDVEKVHPDLIVRDKEGKPYSVRYDQVNAMLLNEFLKEHRKVRELEAALEAVNERLNGQEAQMEKVSAQLELGKPEQPRK